MVHVSRRLQPSDAKEDHPIHAAAEAGHTEVVRSFVDANPTLVHDINRGGGQPLHCAVIGRSRAVVDVLLERGADIHAVHGAGVGSRSGYAPQVRQPIERPPAGPQCPSRRRGRTMAHRPACAAILLEFGADLSPKDTQGETPLAWALMLELTDIADFLKARGGSRREPIQSRPDSLAPPCGRVARRHPTSAPIRIPIDVDIRRATPWYRQRHADSIDVPGKAVQVQTSDTIDNQMSTIRDNARGPASVARVGEVRVRPRQAALLEEFWALNDRLTAMAQSEGAGTNAK